MKTAHIVGKLKAGGVESVVFSYLRRMDIDGISVDVLYDSDSTVAPPKDLIERGIRFIEIPPYQSVFKYIKKVKKLCLENRYDIVHSHINSLSGLPLYAAKKAGVKHRIAHNHTTSSKIEGKRDTAKRLTRPITGRYATDYAACSEKAARWMWGDEAFEKGYVKIFNNAVDVEKFKFDADAREDVRRENGIGNEFVLLHVGRFVTTKNHPFIIDIFSELKCLLPDSKLILVGDGETLDETKKKVDLLGLSDCVIFKGIVEDTERYYSAADVFVLPSLYEGLPVVAIEAEASGLNCFISDDVTRECAVTPHVKFLPLSDGQALWAKAVAEAPYHDRSDDYKLVKESKFNIERSADEMRKYYFEITGAERRM